MKNKRYHVVVYVEAPTCRDLRDALSAAEAKLAPMRGRITVAKVKEAPSRASGVVS